jgi:hypothetical protein
VLQGLAAGLSLLLLLLCQGCCWVQAQWAQLQLAVLCEQLSKPAGRVAWVLI